MTNRSYTENFSQLGPNKNVSVWPFFALVFLSWLVWIPHGAARAGVLSFPVPSEFAWAGVFMPMFLSFIFIYRAGGVKGVTSHLKRFIKVRFPLRYWVFALLAIPASALMLVIGYSLFVEPIFLQGIEKLLDGTVKDALLKDYQEGNVDSLGYDIALFQWMGSTTTALVVGFIAIGLMDGGVSEEPGWRGFAYPILQDRWGSLPAALMVAMVWALWHIGPKQWEILFADGTGAFLAFLPGHLLLYVVGVTPLAIIFSWLYEKSGGSLLVCFVVHDMFNNTSILSYMMFPQFPFILGVVVVLWLTVIAILIKNGWRSFGGAEGQRS